MISPELLKTRLENPPVYHMPISDWDIIWNDIRPHLSISKGRKCKYYEVPIAFDIETTSTKRADEKLAFMYCWQVSIEGIVILGRTWNEFDDFYHALTQFFETWEELRVIIYVQNLAYEFQFLSRRLDWESVFCLKERKPLKAVTKDFVEFRCSYMLSGFSLAVIGRNLQRYKIQKLEGDLDYELVRHYNTPLTEKEWGYCINDVQVVVAYIQETVENDGGYHKVPLTKTGYVREYCRNECQAVKGYRDYIKALTLTVDDYIQLQRAFAGGFTHANWHYVGMTLENMDSYDFTSSYPTVMVAEYFPMSPFKSRRIDTKSDFELCLKKYACLFDVEIEGLDGWDAPDHILSHSKCWEIKNAQLNNGRIISADHVCTTVTEIDFQQLRKFYKWKRFRIANFKVADKAYLPTPFVKSILKLYSDKTILKDVEGKEVEYMKSKGMINSAYGMTVTDIVRDEETFKDDEWTIEKASPEAEIAKYNKSGKRFLFYAWGVWVTAYARANLYRGILEFGDDYVYSDTDSVKVRNASRHLDFIEEYNAEIIEKLQRACDYHGLPYEMISPKTIKGKSKPLGVWDYDGHYDYFKTLGAKRYMIERDGEVNITVAGLNKKTAVPYIKELAEEHGATPFDEFTDDLYIPRGKAGKMVHTYLDYEIAARVTDYLGNESVVHEYSAVHLELADYSLSLEAGFLKLLQGYHYVKV